ncbi:MAG: hypothetical protein DMD40_13015 [Gemmatimonadetes bacterium]|nr:MAG: hypothetical protein DMD40_13015 [Gemmatimonadota bacterium]
MNSPWVTERLALTALDYPIPQRANRLDFMLGALTLVALTLLALTGIVLTQYYNPAPLSAHESIRYIITAQPFVAFVRDVHVWSASAALVLVFTHVAAVFWRRGYRSPWVTGLATLAIALSLIGGALLLRRPGVTQTGLVDRHDSPKTRSP